MDLGAIGKGRLSLAALVVSVDAAGAADGNPSWRGFRLEARPGSALNLASACHHEHATCPHSSELAASTIDACRTGGWVLTAT